MPVIALLKNNDSTIIRKYIESKFIKSLKYVGADVKLIGLENPADAVKQAIKCDGLLLPGGADVNPALYGEAKDKKCGKTDDLRDTADSLILSEFLKEGKPVFAICRGIQYLNVHMGGTLFQDITDIQEYKHRNLIQRPRGVHSIEIYEGTKLYDIFETKRESVNSLHHQAIKTVGNGLRVCAKSPDGFVEAVELENHPFCVGVQWHPEFMSKNSDQQRKLFSAYAKACK